MESKNKRASHLFQSVMRSVNLNMGLVNVVLVGLVVISFLIDCVQASGGIENCETKTCLLNAGCVPYFDIYPFPSNPINKKRCLDNKNSFDEFRLCYQIKDVSGSLETKMRHGFSPDDHWMVEHSDHIQHDHDYYDGINSPYLITQNYNNRSSEVQYFLTFRPGGGLLQTYSPIFGKLVASWNHRVHRVVRNDLKPIGSLKLTISSLESIKYDELVSSKEIFNSKKILQEYQTSFSALLDTKPTTLHHSLEENVWVENVKHLNVLDSNQHDVVHIIKLENPSYGLQLIDLKDFEMLVCPISTSKIQKRNYSQCPKFNPGAICLCHLMEKTKEFRKICVSNSASDSHLRHGDFYVGESDSYGNLYDCDCKLIQKNQTNSPQPSLTPLPAPQPPISSTPSFINRCLNNSKLLFACRDFFREHPDMQYIYLGKVEEGIVAKKLNETTKKPIWNEPQVLYKSVTNQHNFETWFKDGKDVISNKWVILGDESKFNSSSYGGLNFYPFDGLQEDKNNNSTTHNYYFTCEAHGYLESSNLNKRLLSFQSSGDLWVYVDGNLIIDLGGTHPITERSISLDLLNLSPLTSHRVDIFYANRFPPSSDLWIKGENVCLTCFDGKYDVCGVCGGNGDSCALQRHDLMTKDIPCDVNDIESPCWRSQSERVAHGDNLIHKSSKCFVNISPDVPNVYQFEFSMDLEQPYSQPSLLLISLFEYDGFLRNRGNCDTIGSEVSNFYWSDTINLWNPEYVGATSLMWEKTSQSVNSHTKRIVLRVNVSLETLFSCHSGKNELSLISKEMVGENKQTYSGTWFLNRIVPQNLNKENEGSYLLYSSQCSFSITEGNIPSENTYSIYSGLNTKSELPETAILPVELKPTSKDIIMSVFWLQSYCSNNRSISSTDGPKRILDLGFVIELKTCIKTTLSPWWTKLEETPILYYKNSINGTWNNSVFDLHPLGTIQMRECNIADRTSPWNCCQKWLMYGKEAIYPPLSGEFKIMWNAEVYKTGYTFKDSNEDTSVYTKVLVLSQLNIDVLEECDNLKNLYCDSTNLNLDDNCATKDAKTKKLILGNTLSTLHFYLKQDSTSSWDITKDGPLLDGIKIFGTFSPQLSSKSCIDYTPVITEIYSEVYPFDINSGEYSNISCSKTIEYLKGNVALNEQMGIQILEIPPYQCFVNFSWTVRKRDCDPEYYRVHPKPPNSFRNVPNTQQQQQQQQHTSMQWNEKTSQWIIGGGEIDLNALSLKRGTDQIAQTKTILHIKWELTLTAQKLNPSQNSLKRAILQDTSGVLQGQDFTQTHYSPITVTCQDFYEWNSILGKCVSKSLLWWFPTGDAPWIWIMVGVFIFFFFVIMCCVCFSFWETDSNLQRTQRKRGREKLTSMQTTNSNSWWTPTWNNIVYWYNDRKKKVKTSPFTPFYDEPYSAPSTVHPISSRIGENNNFQAQTFDSGFYSTTETNAHHRNIPPKHELRHSWSKMPTGPNYDWRN